MECTDLHYLEVCKTECTDLHYLEVCKSFAGHTDPHKVEKRGSMVPPALPFVMRSLTLNKC